MRQSQSRDAYLFTREKPRELLQEFNIPNETLKNARKAVGNDKGECLLEYDGGITSLPSHCVLKDLASEQEHMLAEVVENLEAALSGLRALVDKSSDQHLAGYNKKTMRAFKDIVTVRENVKVMIFEVSKASAAQFTLFNMSAKKATKSIHVRKSDTEREERKQTGIPCSSRSQQVDHATNYPKTYLAFFLLASLYGDEADRTALISEVSLESCDPTMQLCQTARYKIPASFTEPIHIIL